MARILVKTCSRCRKPNDRLPYRYCSACHAAYVRDWRKGNPLTGGQKNRDAARHYAAVYQRRGKLAAQSCEACGDPKAEKHHQDHERPLDVTWLCRPCHLSWHAFWREVSRLTFQQWLLASRAPVPADNHETSTEAA